MINKVGKTQTNILNWQIIFYIAILVIVILFIYFIYLPGNQPFQLIELAKSFREGKLHIDKISFQQPDYISYNEKTYVPVGPFSAITLVPFLKLIDFGIKPGWISLLFTSLSAFILNRILILRGIENQVRKWVILLYFGGTAYLTVAITIVSWNYSHVIVSMLLFFALLLTLKNRSPLIIGLIAGLAFATRASLIFSSIIFPLLFLGISFERNNKFQKSKFLSWLFEYSIGYSIVLVGIFVYNYQRFGNILETGYSISTLATDELEYNRSIGLFHTNHFLRNFYFLFINLPKVNTLATTNNNFPCSILPSPYGLSIFFTSPALLLVFRKKPLDRINKVLLLGITLQLIPVLFHYATGWMQFGYRYSLDFMPYLILILSSKINNKIEEIDYLLITLSVFINLWGLKWMQTWLL